jgi:NAD(P)-dependent dehydrogenase (short-subunit alcohol dehydrogenase family)
VEHVGSPAGVTALGRGHIAGRRMLAGTAWRWALTREFSIEWAGGGVCVNAILPAVSGKPQAA